MSPRTIPSLISAQVGAANSCAAGLADGLSSVLTVGPASAGASLGEQAASRPAAAISSRARWRGRCGISVVLCDGYDEGHCTIDSRFDHRDDAVGTPTRRGLRGGRRGLTQLLWGRPPRLRG